MRNAIVGFMIASVMFFSVQPVIADDNYIGYLRYVRDYWISVGVNPKIKYGSCPFYFFRARSEPCYSMEGQMIRDYEEHMAKVKRMKYRCDELIEKTENSSETISIVSNPSIVRTNESIVSNTTGGGITLFGFGYAKIQSDKESIPGKTYISFIGKKGEKAEHINVENNNMLFMIDNDNPRLIINRSKTEKKRDERCISEGINSNLVSTTQEREEKIMYLTNEQMSFIN